MTALTRDDGTLLHIVEDGDPTGPPVVLAHGYLGDHTGYDPIRRELVARGHRVVLFDQRGHGRSKLGRGSGATGARRARWLPTTAP